MMDICVPRDVYMCGVKLAVIPGPLNGWVWETGNISSLELLSHQVGVL